MNTASNRTRGPRLLTPVETLNGPMPTPTRKPVPAPSPSGSHEPLNDHRWVLLSDGEVTDSAGAGHMRDDQVSDTSCTGCLELVTRSQRLLVGCLSLKPLLTLFRGKIPVIEDEGELFGLASR